MVEIQNNAPGGDSSSSAMTSMVAILVIVIIAVIVYFGFVKGRGVAAPASNGINVELNTPAGGGAGTVPTGSGSSGGAAQ